MIAMSSLRRIASKGRAWASSYIGDRKGIAAVEFAIVVPLLLSMYFVTLEVGQGIETNKKIGRIASMVGDLATQEQSVTKDDLDAILQIGASIIQPYNRSTPTIVITGIQLSSATDPVAKVVWRRKIVDGVTSGSVSANEETTVPPTLKVKNSFLVRVEASLAYKPVIAWAVDQQKATGIVAPFNNLNMAETYYLRSRMSPTVICSNC